MIKYILDPDQVLALLEAHKRIIENGLIKLGFDYSEHDKFFESANKTFNSILNESQRILTEKGIKEHIRLEIKRDNDTNNE